MKYILVVTPAFAHHGYATLLKGRVRSDQVIVVYPGAFAALLFRRVFGDLDCPVVADVNNLPYDARVTAPCRGEIYGCNDVNVAFMPAARGSGLIEEMRAIHQYKTWSHIGKAVGVETPVIDSIVNIYNVVHERNWWEEGNAASTKRGSAPSGSRLAEECRYVSTDRLHPPWGNSRAASLLPNRTSVAADAASPGTPPGYQSGARGA